MQLCRPLEPAEISAVAAHFEEKIAPPICPSRCTCHYGQILKRVNQVPSHFKLIFPSAIKSSKTCLPIVIAADGYIFSLGRSDSDLRYERKASTLTWFQTFTSEWEKFLSILYKISRVNSRMCILLWIANTPSMPRLTQIMMLLNHLAPYSHQQSLRLKSWMIMNLNQSASSPHRYTSKWGPKVASFSNQKSMKRSVLTPDCPPNLPTFHL